MTLKEFREQTKDLDENVELWYNLSLLSGSAHFKIEGIRHYKDKPELVDKLFLNNRDMKLKIQVTEEDIEQGKSKSSTQCPIALATKRVLDNRLDYYDLEVAGHGEIRFYSNNIQYEFSSDKIRQFITDFDSGEIKVFPFEIEANFHEYELEPDND